MSFRKDTLEIPRNSEGFLTRLWDSLCGLIKPAPHFPVTDDPQTVKKRYGQWRLRIFASTFIGYAFYYFSRKSFTYTSSGVMQDLGLTHCQVGILFTILNITYSISKFSGGVLLDRSNPRFFMAVGLFITGLVNFLFGMSSSFLVFAILWTINGTFQGCGWPPCAKILTHWFSRSERGFWWSLLNLSINLGAFTTPWVVSIFMGYFGWRWGMYVPGIICMVAGLVVFYCLRDTPEAIGLPSIEEHKNEPIVEKHQKKDLPFKELFIKYILKNKYVWMLGLGYFFIYFMRMGFTDWIKHYFIEEKGYSDIAASGCASLFDMGGLVGSLMAGWASDKIFKAKRGPVTVIFSVGLILAVLSLLYMPKGLGYLDSVAIFTIGMMVFGPQMLIGIMAVEVSHKNAAGSSTGFIGFFAYIGAAIAGCPLGLLIQHFGWVTFFTTMALCAAIILGLTLPMWKVTSYQEKYTQ